MKHPNVRVDAKLCPGEILSSRIYIANMLEHGKFSYPVKEQNFNNFNVH